MAITRPLFAGDDPTPASVKRRQLLAEQLLADNSGVQQISHPLQAVAQVLGAGVGSHLQRRADRDEATGLQSRRDGMMRIADQAFGGGAPSFGVTSMQSSSTSRLPSMPSRTASLPSGERAGYIRQGLISRGLPEHVADGFLANFQDESGLDPGINERNPIVPGSRGGFGLYQLTGSRRREYEAFAGQRGVDPSDIDAQLDFLMGELQGSERRAGERILGSRDTASAAQAIVNDFLRPSPEHRQSRSARYAGLSGQSRPSYAAGAVLPDRVNVYDEGGLRTVDAAEYGRQARATHTRPDNVVPYSGPGASIDNNSPVHDENGFRMQTEADRARYGRGGVQVASLDPSEAMASALGAQPANVSPANQALGAALTGGGASPSPMQPQTSQTSPALSSGQQDPMVAQLLGGQQAQPAPGVNRALIAELLSNPWTEDMGQSLLMQQIETQQRNSDPLRQIELQRAQLELEALRNPRQEPIEVGGVLLDPQTMQPIFDSRSPSTATVGNSIIDTRTGQPIYQGEAPKPTSVQEFEYGQETPGFFEQQERQRRAGATNVTQTSGEGNKFYETLDADNAKVFSALSEEGVRGTSKLAQIDRLEGLLASSPSGGAAAVKLWLGERGINSEGLDSAQAAQALINELVPQQRQPGSGPMSDSDLALFKQSLPRLINQPGANQTIISTMRGITEYQIQMGRIADAVADRALTPAQAREQIRGLANPLEGFRPPAEAPQPSPQNPSVSTQPPLVSGMGGSAPETSAMPTAVNPETGEMIQWNGREWVPMQ